MLQAGYKLQYCHCANGRDLLGICSSFHRFIALWYIEDNNIIRISGLQWRNWKGVASVAYATPKIFKFVGSSGLTLYLFF